MAYAHINFFSQTGRTYDTSTQVFDGDCSQNRVDLTNLDSTFPTTANAIVANPTKFVQIVTDSKIKVYSGSSTADDTYKQARAFVMNAGTYSLSAKTGDVIHIWTA